MKRDVAIFGLSSFGQNLAHNLVEAGHHVVVVDRNPNRVELLKEKVTNAVIADLCYSTVIQELECSKFDVIILDFGGNLETLIMCVTHLQNEGVSNIVAKVEVLIHRDILNRLGVTDVIVPDQESANLLADKITTPNILELFEIEDGSIVKVVVPESMNGKTLKELDLRRQYEISAILIKKNGMKKSHMLSKHNFILETGDELTVMGDKKDIQKAFGT